jgi:hypothetical protein
MIQVAVTDKTTTCLFDFSSIMIENIVGINDSTPRSPFIAKLFVILDFELSLTDS